MNTHRGPVNDENNVVDFNDLDSSKDQSLNNIFQSTGTPDEHALGLGSHSLNIPNSMEEGKKLEKEIRLTTKLGAAVGVDMSNFQSLIQESIVKEGIQSGIK